MELIKIYEDDNHYVSFLLKADNEKEGEQLEELVKASAKAGKAEYKIGVITIGRFSKNLPHRVTLEITPNK